ncbi:MAG: helix-turn-helix transcriptional regulator [Prevotellaceae bacterium]|jgi:DNA-binding XRE family transcriptional regulator|nr:helix-turn-helix transcriptional regulator [Prevotellaceae bacterium]
MNLINKNKLNGKIAENGLTQKSLAHIIGISKNSLCSKINGKSAFNVNEIEDICDALNISSSVEKADIFLATASLK